MTQCHSHSSLNPRLESGVPAGSNGNEEIALIIRVGVIAIDGGRRVKFLDALVERVAVAEIELVAIGMRVLFIGMSDLGTASDDNLSLACLLQVECADNCALADAIKRGACAFRPVSAVATGVDGDLVVELEEILANVLLQNSVVSRGGARGEGRGGGEDGAREGDEGNEGLHSWDLKESGWVGLSLMGS
jgi:hypothetical protein